MRSLLKVGVQVAFVLVTLLCHHQSFATAWTTAAAGPVNTLTNWTDGSVSPSSFTTPGDTWTVVHSMTLPASATWTIGTAASTVSTLTFGTGGTISMSGAGSTFTIIVHGNVDFSGGTLSLGGAGTTCNFTINGNATMSAGAANSIASTTILNVNVNGNFTMSGGNIATSGASSDINWNTHGNFSMTAGTFTAGGAGADIVHNVYGNCSFTGTAAMLSTGAGTTSTVHLAWPSASGTMMIENVSTATWSGTNIFVDAGCTAQLSNNFSTTTGAAAFGITVNGTLICPSSYIVNGTRKFTLSSLATLVVAHAGGVNGAITTSGTTSFATDANYTFNGTVPQVPGSYMPVSLVSPSKLTVSNAAGVTLSSSVSTTGSLVFTAGILNTGAFTMTTPGSAGAVSGAGATSYVNGTLIKTISGLTSVNYEVGDVNYAPMQLTFTGSGTGGSIGLKTTNGLHPSVGTSGLTSSNMANHYWTITTYGASGPTTITPVATYNAADILGGSNAAFQSQKFSSAAWLSAPVASANTVSPYTSQPVTGIALVSIAGDYIFGNVFCGTEPITGTATVCVGSTTSLACATPGGAWTSTTPTVATISSGGVVTGIAVGTSTISYTVSGCTVTRIVTVSAAPDAGTISGVTSACIGMTTSLSSSVSGGTWSSSTPGVGTVSTTGVVAGIAAGTTVISYTVTNGCGTATATVTVNVATTLFVAPITGVDSVCPGFTDTLHCATGGGVWTSTNPSLATVSATGVVTGVAPGYDTIVYTVTSSCGTVAVKFRIKVRNPVGCPVGVGEVAQLPDGITVYPNPNNGTFVIRYSVDGGNAPAHVVITDVMGRVVHEQQLRTNTEEEIRLNRPPGIYFVNAVSGNSRYTKKVMVR
ncbi:MAG: T9SS type A sorting domain-containing protein [Taibaiella sp.]|nr:T9SS type A sorting domain-containing protein [Taibaiella sp.]